MRAQRLRRALLAILAFSVLLDVYSLSMMVHTLTTHPGVPIYDYLIEGAIGGVVLLTLTVIMILRRPEHPVTWALLATGIFGSLQGATGSYAVEAIISAPGSLPNGHPAQVISGVAQMLFVLSFMFTINLFPSGRFLTPRWRWLILVFVPLVLLASLDLLINPEPVEGVVIEPLIAGELPVQLQVTLVVLVAGFILGSIAHVVVRYVRSRGAERLQLKWFAFTFVVGVAVLVMPWSEIDAVGSVLWTLVPSAILGSMVVAILRYRLYEIDRIISRTVTYGLVVGVLGLVILGLVASLALVLPSDDPLVVAVATLAAAALFNPVRRRVQSLVDRRFNRARYVSERVIDEFAGSLRDRVDQDEVLTDWVGVVSETMQPAAVGVWVRP